MPSAQVPCFSCCDVAQSNEALASVTRDLTLFYATFATDGEALAHARTQRNQQRLELAPNHEWTPCKRIAAVVVVAMSHSHSHNHCTKSYSITFRKPRAMSCAG